MSRQILTEVRGASFQAGAGVVGGGVFFFLLFCFFLVGGVVHYFCNSSSSSWAGRAVSSTRHGFIEINDIEGNV